MKFQRTILKETSVSGRGLHTGEEATVTFKPAAADTGIRFIRTDLPDRPSIQVESDTVLKDPSYSRCTVIQKGDARVSTMEHLMAALFGLGIDNLDIEINAEEVPGLDGSSLDFLNLLKEAGLKDYKEPKRYYQIKQPLCAEENGASILIVPADDFRVSYSLSYDHPQLGSQFVDMVVDEQTFEKDIAPCRTFCLEKEAKQLQDAGLGKGANTTNTLVVGQNGVIDNKLRFPDECARHKMLDVIGDLYMLGRPIKGHVFAVKSGHRLNHTLLGKINKQLETYESHGFSPDLFEVKGSVLSVEDIMKILPHRYPFLFVDRITEFESGKRAVGYKNVTINDEFFRGHFPQKPVMPGVLMVEAMAQVAGAVILTDERHRGKLALFMGIDQVKFRKLVEPGDQLIMEVEMIKDRSRVAQLKGVGTVNGELVVQANMTFSFMDSSFLYG